MTFDGDVGSCLEVVAGLFPPEDAWEEKEARRPGAVVPSGRASTLCLRCKSSLLEGRFFGAAPDTEGTLTLALALRPPSPSLSDDSEEESDEEEDDDDEDGLSRLLLSSSSLVEEDSLLEEEDEEEVEDELDDCREGPLVVGSSSLGDRELDSPVLWCSFSKIMSILYDKRVLCLR